MLINQCVQTSNSAKHISPSEAEFNFGRAKTNMKKLPYLMGPFFILNCRILKKFDICYMLVGLNSRTIVVAIQIFVM